MSPKRTHFANATAFAAILALAGCSKDEPTALPAQLATSKAPAAASEVPTTVSVTGLDLGTSVGANMKLDAAMTTFAPTDTIIAAVSTATSDPSASVPAKLGVKWSDKDGKVINDESKDAKFTGNGVTDFRIANPAGYPVGKYKVEILLNGRVVKGKDFEIK